MDPREVFEKFILSRIWSVNYGEIGTVEVGDFPLYELLDRQVKWFPGRVAVVYGGSKVRYGTLGEHSDRLASALRDFRVRKGDVVMLHLPNTPHFIASYYAALKVGAVVAPVDPSGGPRVIERCAGETNPRVVFTMDELYRDIVDSGYPFDYVVVGSPVDYSSQLRRILRRGRGRVGFRRCSIMGYSEVLRNYEPMVDRERIDPREDLAAVNYTDGVAGGPKGVELTHHNIVANLHQIKPMYEALRRGGARSPLVVMGLFPWFHSYGQVAVMHYSIFEGNTLVTPRTYEAGHIVRAIREHRVQVLHGAPSDYARLQGHPGLRGARSLLLCLSSASPLPKDVLNGFREATGMVIRNVFFTTEGLLTHMEPIHGEHREGSIGVPLPGTYAAIAHLKEPILLPPGEFGELVVSGPQVARGYRGFRCESCFFDYGGLRWFRTGDVGYMDKDGYFYVIERRENLIRYKGYLIPPREVEDSVRTHPCVDDVAIVGVPNGELGEVPKAYIVLKGDCRGKVTREEMITWFQDRLSPYRRPRIVEFIDALPRTRMGRVAKRLLKESPTKA